MSRLALSQAQDEANLKVALDELDPFVSWEFADDVTVCNGCGEFFEVYMLRGRSGNLVTHDDHVCEAA